MEALDLLHTHLMEECPFIHGKRLQAAMECGMFTSEETKFITDSDRKRII